MSLQKVSSGKLFSKEQLGSLVPQVVLEPLKNPTGKFLVVFVPKEDRIRIEIIPLKSREILKILVHLVEFSPVTLKSIADIIYDLKISTVYTSGICIQQTGCYYEAYVEMEKKDDLSTIREKFLRIPQCKAVDLEMMSDE